METIVQESALRYCLEVSDYKRSAVTVAKLFNSHVQHGGMVLNQFS